MEIPITTVLFLIKTWLTHLLTHSLTHAPTHPPTHSLTHSLSHSLILIIFKYHLWKFVLLCYRQVQDHSQKNSSFSNATCIIFPANVIFKNVSTMIRSFSLLEQWTNLEFPDNVFWYWEKGFIEIIVLSLSLNMKYSSMDKILFIDTIHNSHLIFI